MHHDFVRTRSSAARRPLAVPEAAMSSAFEAATAPLGWLRLRDASSAHRGVELALFCAHVDAEQGRKHCSKGLTGLCSASSLIPLFSHLERKAERAQTLSNRVLHWADPKGSVTCLRSHSPLEAELGLEFRPQNSTEFSFNYFLN